MESKANTVRGSVREISKQNAKITVSFGIVNI